METVSPSTDFIYPVPLPWPDIFEDLRGVGLNPTKIATMMGKSRSGIQNWIEGKVEPKEKYARVILRLHTMYLGKEQTRQRVYLANTFIEDNLEVFLL